MSDSQPVIIFEHGDGAAPHAGDFALKYYMFDWDDNVLHMPTRIWLERPRGDGWEVFGVSTREFARIRRDPQGWRPRNHDWDSAFEDFYDTGQRGERAFLEDTEAALDPIVTGAEKPAPSFHRFRQALIEGRLFAIITARAHAPDTIRKAVRMFIDRVLTADERAAMLRNLRGFMVHFGEDPEDLSDEQVLDRYLSLNRYHGVTSPEFQRMMGRTFGGAESPEEAKMLAVKDFVAHVIRILQEKGAHHPVHIGFSDDDPHNVQAVEAFVEAELGKAFPGVKFVVYDTSQAEQPEARKVVVQGQLEFDM